MARYILYITLAAVSLSCLNAQVQESPRFVEEDYVLEADYDEYFNISTPVSRNEEIRRRLELEILETLGSSPNSKQMWRVRPGVAKKPVQGAAKPNQGKPVIPFEPRKPMVRPPLTPVNKPIAGAAAPVPAAAPAPAVGQVPAAAKPVAPKPPPKQPQLQLAPDMMAITPQIFDVTKPKPQVVQPAPAQIPQHVPAAKPTPVQQPPIMAAAKPVLTQQPQTLATTKPVATPVQPVPIKKPQPPPQPQLVLAPEMSAVIPQVFDPVGIKPLPATAAKPNIGPLSVPAHAPTAPVHQLTTPPAPIAAPLLAPAGTLAVVPVVDTVLPAGTAPDIVGMKVQHEPEPFIPVVIERDTTPLPFPEPPIYALNAQAGANANQPLQELPMHELLFPDYTLTTEPFVEVVFERDTTPHPQYEPPVFIATTERPPPPPMPGQLPPPISPDLLANAHLPMPDPRPPPQYPPASLKPTSPQPLILVTPSQPVSVTPRPVAPVPQSPRPVVPPTPTPAPQPVHSQTLPQHLPSPQQAPHLPSPHQAPHLPSPQQAPHLPSPQPPPHSPSPQHPPPQLSLTTLPPHLPTLASQPAIQAPITQQQPIQTTPFQPLDPVTPLPEVTIPATPPPPPPPTIVLPSGGQLIGSSMETVGGKPVDAFRGIPYAKPPVGRLRFAPPEPHPPITGVRNVQEDGSPCPQHEYLNVNATFGSEDCLYLNVYAPQNRSMLEPLPVMVFFHGGGFSFGSSHSAVYGPERLLAHDVLLVTSNYRLGALGFLSTGTLDCPGNNGLKDQVEVLKWVQANIAAFGGDPQSVTIFGQSAGAASVTYHLVSPKTEGLFHKAIAQSGNNYDCWAFIQNRTAAYRAKRLRLMLDCVTVGAWPYVLDCLRNKTAEEIILASNSFYSFGKDPITSFGPVVEPEHPDAYLTVKPRDIARPHSVHLPLMIGVNAEEGVMKSGPLTNIYDEDFRQKFRKVLPKLLYYDDWPKQTRIQITNKVDSFYFKGNHSWTKEDPGELTALFSERLFYSGMDQYLRNRFAQRNGTFGDTFAYLFDQKGPITLSAQYGSGPFYYGVVHGDELPYLFTMNASNAPSTYNDGRFKWAMPRMWTHFAITGTPTPDDSPVRKWKPATKFKLRYAQIGSKNLTDMVVIKNSVGFMDPKMRFWRGVQINMLSDSPDMKGTKLIP